MKEQTTNLWDVPADAICITTNGYVNSKGQAVMGRGCALEAKEKFPGIENYFGDLITKYGNHVQQLWVDSTGLPDLISFPVKHHWRDIADLLLIVRSARELVVIANEYGYQNIYLPRPGCGNGLLTWGYVKPGIQDILDDRFTVVTK